MTEETPPFVGPNGCKILVDEEVGVACVQNEVGMAFLMPLEDFEAFVAFWNRRDPLLCAAAELLDAAKRWLREFDLYNVPPRQEQLDAERDLRAAIARIEGRAE